MSDNNTQTFEMEQVNTSGNYAVYDAPEAPDGSKAVKGLAVIETVAEQVGENIELVLSEEATVNLVHEKSTSATGRYCTEGPAIRHIYVSHDVLAELGGDGSPDSAPESLGAVINSSTAENFEEAQEALAEEMAEDAEDEVAGLLGETGDSEDAEDEEVEISDEEVGLVGDA